MVELLHLMMTGWLLDGSSQDSPDHPLVHRLTEKIDLVPKKSEGVLGVKSFHHFVGAAV